MFNMKFHADERSMDMTRRRRWHRKMVPSAEENVIMTSNGAVVANTDIIFRMQSQITPDNESIPKSDTALIATDSSSSSTTNKDIKIELNAPRMFLSFKSKYSI